MQTDLNRSLRNPMSKTSYCKHILAKHSKPTTSDCGQLAAPGQGAASPTPSCGVELCTLQATALPASEPLATSSFPTSRFSTIPSPNVLLFQSPTGPLKEKMKNRFYYKTERYTVL